MRILFLSLLLAAPLLLATPADDPPEKPTSNLTIVEAEVFFDTDFWETPEGAAFWETPEGKQALQAMTEYRYRIENQ
jgi:hypothetical protein